MKLLLLPLAFMLSNSAIASLRVPTTPEWTRQTSGVTVRLRGVSAANDKVAWASGAGNTVLRTADGGVKWEKIELPATMRDTPLDFRDIDAIDARTAYLLSIGDAAASRIFKTTDAGATWTLQYTNPDPKGFLDAMTFWDADNGLVIGDSIDGRLQILITSDGGATWTKVPETALPPALPNEGAFSASGSNIAMVGSDYAWIGLNAGTTSRVLHTSDRGRTWTTANTPMPSTASAGIFSVAFRDAKHGVIVGGDYKSENTAVDNVAVTSDGGKTWSLVKKAGLSGFRSAVKYLPGNRKSLIAVGPTGADLSSDDGKTWTPLVYPAPITGFDAISFAPGHESAWASGNRGELGRLTFK